MKNADYVLTNSFHGTAFSVIFEKQFMVIPHSNTGNRVTELLDRINLSTRHKKLTVDAVKEMTNPIDYTKVRPVFNELKKESIDFLSDTVERIGRK